MLRKPSIRSVIKCYLVVSVIGTVAAALSPIVLFSKYHQELNIYTDKLVNEVTQENQQPTTQPAVDLMEQKAVEIRDMLGDLTESLVANLVWTSSAITLLMLIVLIVLGALFLLNVLTYTDAVSDFANNLKSGNYDAKLYADPIMSEFQRMSRDLESMRDKIKIYRQEEQDLAKAANNAWKFSRQIAHDLHSPLSALSVGIQTLKKNNAEGKECNKREVIELLERVSLRLTEMISSIRSPRGNTLQTTTKFELNTLLGEVVEEFVAKYREADPKITFSTPKVAGQVDIIASQSNIRRVLTNIVQNAVESIDGEGEITIDIIHNRNQATVSIRDNGQGISESCLPHIFKEGFTSEKPTGTGLGLHFCDKVISEHGGKIDVTSTIGQGTVFYITLPLPVYANAPSSNSNNKYAINVLANRQLIVIDDSTTMLSRWYQLAAKQGIEGSYFSSFEEAKRNLSWDSFTDVYGTVVVDYVMPNSTYNGIQICNEIRSKLNGSDYSLCLCTSEPNIIALQEYQSRTGINILPKAHFDDFNLIKHDQHAKGQKVT